MEDQFLYGLRQPPSPEFTTALKRRLCASRVGLVLSQRVLKVAACVAVFAVAASLLPGGSALKSEAFGKFASVGGYVSDLIRAASRDLPQVVGSQIDFVKDGEIQKGAEGNANPTQGDPIAPNVGRAPSAPCGTGQTLGPTVGRLLKDAIVLVKSGKYAEALALAQEAERVPNKTTYEDCVTVNTLAGIESMVRRYGPSR